MTIMATVRAITESGQTYDDPAEETLYNLLSELNLCHRFLIVERPHAQQHYIQVCLEDDGSCLVEYREGGPHSHYQARIPAPYAFHGHDTAAGIINSWARNDGHWRTALPWTLLTP